MYDGTVMRNWSIGEYLLRRYQELSTFVVASSGKLPMSCASGRNSFGRKIKVASVLVITAVILLNDLRPFFRQIVMLANRQVGKTANGKQRMAIGGTVFSAEQCSCIAQKISAYQEKTAVSGELQQASFS